MKFYSLKPRSKVIVTRMNFLCSKIYNFVYTAFRNFRATTATIPIGKIREDHAGNARISNATASHSLTGTDPRLTPETNEKIRRLYRKWKYQPLERAAGSDILIRY